MQIQHGRISRNKPIYSYIDIASKPNESLSQNHIQGGPVQIFQNNKDIGIRNAPRDMTYTTHVPLSKWQNTSYALMSFVRFKSLLEHSYSFIVYFNSRF